jgi:hypothetical protein
MVGFAPFVLCLLLLRRLSLDEFPDEPISFNVMAPKKSFFSNLSIDRTGFQG